MRRVVEKAIYDMRCRASGGTPAKRANERGEPDEPPKKPESRTSDPSPSPTRARLPCVKMMVPLAKRWRRERRCVAPRHFMRLPPPRTWNFPRRLASWVASRGRVRACDLFFRFLFLCNGDRYITHPARFVPRLFPYIGLPPTRYFGLPPRCLTRSSGQMESPPGVLRLS